MEARRYKVIYTYEKEHWWYRGRRFLLKLLLASLNPDKKTKILDIGCGGGFNLNILQKFGRIQGIDIEPKSVSYSKKRGFEIKLVKNNYKLPFEKNSFDFITCLDVLEHIEDDERYLREILRILRPNGRVIIFVPAYEFLWGELDTRSRHYRRYTKKDLIMLFKNAGLKPALSMYFNFLFFLPILLVRFLQKFLFWKNTPWGIDPVIGSYKINKILTGIFCADIILSRLISPPFGVSLCVVAEKLTIPEVKPSGKNR